MADITFHIDIRQQGDALTGLRARLLDMGPALEEGANQLEHGVYPAFEAGDRAWAELAPWTQRERAELGFGAAHPVLVRTGDYRASFTASVNGDELSLASDDPRFDTLNNGGVTETGQAVPPRPLQDVYPEEYVEAAVEDIWQAVIKE